MCLWYDSFDRHTSKEEHVKTLMLPDNDIRIAAAIYAIRLASNDARRFSQIAGVALQSY
jgi:predicted nucleic acid-binding protein